MSGKGVSFSNGHITHRRKDRQDRHTTGIPKRRRRSIDFDDEHSFETPPGRVCRALQFLREPIEAFLDHGRDGHVDEVPGEFLDYDRIDPGLPVCRVGSGRAQHNNSTRLDIWGDLDPRYPVDFRSSSVVYA